MPVAGRVAKLGRLINSMQPLTSHTVTYCLGLDAGAKDRADYDKLFADVTSDTVKIHVTELTSWHGLGVAFNTVCRDLPDHVETIAMFGDDMVFETPAEEVFNEVESNINRWAPSKIGCVIFNDRSWNFHPDRLKQGPPIAINGFLHRNWIDALGHFFPDEIVGDYADNYITELCVSCNRYAEIHDKYIPHLHQSFNPAERDATGNKKIKYEKNVVKYDGNTVWTSTIQPMLPRHLSQLLNYIG